MDAFWPGAVAVVFEGCFMLVRVCGVLSCICLMLIIGVCGTGLLGEVTATVYVATGPFGTVTSLTGLDVVLS